MKKRIVVEISGGVAHVTADSKDVDIAVIDYDVEGCPVSTSIKDKSTGRHERAAICQVENINPEYVDHLFMQL